MQPPVRAYYAFRPHASPGIVSSAIAVSVLFAATPFVIPAVAARLGVTLGDAGLISTMQVGGFATTNLIAPRLLRPDAKLVRVGAGLAVAFSIGSALSGSFAVLMVLRGMTGAAGGLLTWLAWTEAMTDTRSMRDVAASGPVAALVASPVIGVIASAADDRVIYLLIGAAMCAPLLLPTRLVARFEERTGVSPSRSNRVLLAALFLLTLGGSSLFVFLAAVGQSRVGLGALAVSLGFSANAAAGIVGARLTARPGTGGRWLLLTAAAAVSVVAFPHPIVYFAAMALWGFAFWMGIPETLRAIRARSLTPAERSGDAQALMAFGRSLGPLMGGLVLGNSRFLAVGIVAGSAMAGASTIISLVERHRGLDDG